MSRTVLRACGTTARACVWNSPPPPTYVDKKGKVRAKGIRRILRDRGLQMRDMKGKCKPRCPIRKRGSGPFCCMTRVLAHQPDFMPKRTLVEQVIEPHPEIKVIYYPKFYSEFNFIELYWRKAKGVTREHQGKGHLEEGRQEEGHQKKGFRETVIEALDRGGLLSPSYTPSSILSSCSPESSLLQ